MVKEAVFDEANMFNDVTYESGAICSKDTPPCEPTEACGIYRSMHGTARKKRNSHHTKTPRGKIHVQQGKSPLPLGPLVYICIT